MKQAIVSGLLLLLSPVIVEAACEENLGFADKDRAKVVCDLEASLPFEVKERAFDPELIYFIAKESSIKGDVRTKHGKAFSGSGEPFTSRANAERAVASVAKRQRCELVELTFEPGKAAAFSLACKMGG